MEFILNPKNPIFVISKGRWESRLTSKTFERTNIPYRIVIEPQEYDDYVKFINKEKIIKLPFSNLGQGSIPARNFVWDFAIKEGHKKHWIIDDNIYDFYRFNRNAKNIVEDGTIFKCAEDFVDRYENIMLSGFNYCKFCIASEKYPPYLFNTRIYSTILIDHRLDLRWRGKYNEDTDLSIRTLKLGYCTVQFNAFLAEKATTMRLKGGNTDSIYQNENLDYQDGVLEKSKSLQEQHPDVAKVVWRWNRWHHFVDYSVFKRNKPLFKKDIKITKGVDNYGMRLKTYEEYVK
tara:strand:+ start:574 stop:1443 length:870 start_codon:yes stop_codon:yes gene_type:complete